MNIVFKSSSSTHMTKPKYTSEERVQGEHERIAFFRVCKSCFYLVKSICLSAICTFFSQFDWINLRFNSTPSRISHGDISARKMIKVDANHKLIRQTYAEKTGKRVTLKDIHNIATRQKKAAQSQVSESGEVHDLAIWLKNLI